MRLIIILLLVVFAGAVVLGLWAAASALRRGLHARLSTTDAEIRRLGDATAWRERTADDMRREISEFRNVIDQMRVREEERRAREEQGWAVLHRVAAVLAGGQKSGRAGENILRESLAHLPPSMVVTDFRVGGRVVEFGLVLPDGKRLPIDSKWSADRELRALADADDPSERERLIRTVERAVAERAREVSGYRDPAVTAPVGVAAVPDAAYAVLRRAHADAYRQGVIVIPYSMALPLVLFLYSLVSRFGSAGDVQACLADLAAALDAMEGTVENKVAKASAMLANAADDLRGHVGKARGSLARARQEQGSIEAAQLPVSIEVGKPAVSIAGGGVEERPRLVGLPP
jgi:DNA recombination protein RmuC